MPTIARFLSLRGRTRPDELATGNEGDLIVVDHLNRQCSRLTAGALCCGGTTDNEGELIVRDMRKEKSSR